MIEPTLNKKEVRAHSAARFTKAEITSGMVPNKNKPLRERRMQPTLIKEASTNKIFNTY